LLNGLMLQEQEQKFRETTRMDEMSGAVKSNQQCKRIYL
jgi:hypothetical protein